MKIYIFMVVPIVITQKNKPLTMFGGIISEQKIDRYC